MDTIWTPEFYCIQCPKISPLDIPNPSLVIPNEVRNLIGSGQAPRRILSARNSCRLFSKEEPLDPLHPAEIDMGFPFFSLVANGLLKLAQHLSVIPLFDANA